MDIRMSQRKLGTAGIESASVPKFGQKLKSLRYEETRPASPPVPVTISPPQSTQSQIHPALRRPVTSSAIEDVGKRDSGLAPTTSTAPREGSIYTRDDCGSSPRTTISTKSTHTPQVMGQANIAAAGGGKKSTSGKEKETPQRPLSSPNHDFSPITTSIPTESLLDFDFMEQLSFSKRGSVMLGGKKAVNPQARENAGRRKPSISMIETLKTNLLSDEIEKESQKVRSMYETQPNLDWRDGRYTGSDFETPGEEEEKDLKDGMISPDGKLNISGTALPVTSSYDNQTKREHELAGGIEDWEDVQGRDVDRYGFIQVRQETSSQAGTSEARPVQRVSTVLQLVSEAPRQRRTFGRTSSISRSTRSLPRRKLSRKVSLRSLNTQDSGPTVVQRSTSRARTFRSATNRLPGYRDRRCVDEAGDMLTLPPGLANIAEEAELGHATLELKKREWSRSEKWRKMAKARKSGANGERMEFDFDTRNPKLIERTWKGIPDRWRAVVWHSFLSTSAQKHKDSASDEQIIADFHALQRESSADDRQIDNDVPRTINSHIMFRRRYRGGQRLLFRVLHALSLYFPSTGYVQGMASLAATLLCYYEEDKTFVMLVRMWQLRGLQKLYETDFIGLRQALAEFQKHWLDDREVAKKLTELDIDLTAYGTRWYLTLFNYSVPFPAQLRVWDVFMLLGDSDPGLAQNADYPFGGGLDVLHAASAALIDATREILLDSDFENAMKVLTNWIPIKDEELMMKVAKAEWKLHRGKKGATRL